MIDQEDKVRYENFLQQLKKSFNNIEITTLGELVKNISLSPSVRGGDKNSLDDNVEYCEVGLRDIDEHNVVTIERYNDKKSGPANKKLVEKYALKENDLLVPYRASRNMKVARFGSNYPVPVVTNASVIHIKMEENTPQDLAILIQAYLSINYVQRYILPKEVYSTESTFKRHLLSINVLKELPVPNFTKVMEKMKGFGELYLRRTAIKNKTVSLRKNSMNLLKVLSKDEDETISLFLRSKDKLPDIQEKEKEILKRLDALLNELVLLQEA